MLTKDQIAQLVRKYCADQAREETDEMAVPSYLHTNPLIPWVFRKRLRKIAGWMRTHRVRTFLDYGCGVGVLCEEMARDCDRIYATDISLGAIRGLKQSYNLENVFLIEPSDIGKEIAPASLDAIVAADVLEHVDDLSPYLTSFASLLKPEGTLVVSGPMENFVYRLARKIAGFSGEYHVRTVYDIEKVFARSQWRRRDLFRIPGVWPFNLFRITLWNPPGSSGG